MIAKLEADPKLAPLAKAWADVSEVQKKRKELSGQSATFRSKIYGIAGDTGTIG